VALADRFVEWSIAKITWRVNLRTRFHQCYNLPHVASRGSDMQRSLTEVTNLIHVFERNLAECRQILILVTAQDLPGSEAIRITIYRHSYSVSKLLGSEHCDPDSQYPLRVVRGGWPILCVFFKGWGFPILNP